ncbi:MAG: D-cysteine desulfhydrase family protein [Candidatus Aminicenantes bacterium]|nr:MAG: D-cysteine desulfhydrase family protein [Candidatus Aminicenantes bacterium]
MAAYSIPEIKKTIQRFPKRDLVHLPTPFTRLDNLTKELGGPNIYIKRDDMTGLGFGGNKSRKLEFIIQDVLDKKADAIITWAGLQSNWCLQTAAAARKFGITPILILFNVYDLPAEYDGNLLLDLILSADIKIREIGKGSILHLEDVDEILEQAAMEVKDRGHTPYIAPIGGSAAGGSMGDPLGAISYVNAYVELKEQAENEGLDTDYVLHASGSGGTQAGLTVGAKALSDNTKVLGVSVSEAKSTYTDYVLDITTDTVAALDLELEVENNDIIVFDEYLGEGYGEVNKDVAEAIRLMSMKEGIFLDPVYTGKAMVALIDLVKKGYFKKEDTVVFFHTGGTAALFPNKKKMENFLNRK